jgi:acetylglutamate kinase
MVAKMESAIEAVRGNVARVHITRWEGPETVDRLLDRSSDSGTIIKNENIQV